MSNMQSAVALVVVLLLSGCGGTIAAQPPHHSMTARALISPNGITVGASRARVDRQWPPDADGVPNCQDSLCVYRLRDLHLTVDYSLGYAGEIVVNDLLVPTDAGSLGWDERWRRVDVWRFLQALVPTSAHRLSCTTIAYSRWKVPAHACAYRWGRRVIVVVRYFQTGNGGDVGETLVTGAVHPYESVEGVKL